MALQRDLDYAAELAPNGFERFASLIGSSWIDEALRAERTPIQHCQTVQIQASNEKCQSSALPPVVPY